MSKIVTGVNYKIRVINGNITIHQPRFESLSFTVMYSPWRRMCPSFMKILVVAPLQNWSDFWQYYWRGFEPISLLLASSHRYHYIDIVDDDYIMKYTNVQPITLLKVQRSLSFSFLMHKKSIKYWPPPASRNQQLPVSQPSTMKTSWGLA